MLTIPKREDLKSGTPEWVKAECLRWLRYQPPERRRRDNISVGVMRYGDAPVQGSSSDSPGPYRMALREGQFYHAACDLPSMLAAAAFAHRRMSRPGQVATYCYMNYREQWLDWRRDHPVFAVECLMYDIADEMAFRLGVDIY